MDEPTERQSVAAMPDRREPRLLFFSTDGLNGSLPWKIANYCRAGALTPEQIYELAQKFDLATKDLTSLSTRLGFHLDTIPSVLRGVIDEDESVSEGHEAVSSVMRQLASARSKLASAECTAQKLRTLDDYPAADLARVNNCASRINQLLQAMDEVEAEFRDVQSKAGLAIVVRFANKSRFPDERRDWVLQSIFLTWHLAGRKLSFTTDTATSKRRGPLLDFVNAVVRCVTSPSSELGAELIVNQIRAKKDSVRLVASVIAASPERFGTT